MFETFSHTADIGLRVQAACLPAVFAEAAEAMFSVIVANPESIQPLDGRMIALSDQRADDLLRDWLGELLFLFETRRLVFSRYQVAVESAAAGVSLEATAWGEPLDLHRHQMGMEVKAVTYHGLRLEPVAGGWLAEVIVDL